MSEHLAKVINLFKYELSPEKKAHLIDSIAQLAIQKDMIDSEMQRLTNILDGEK